MVALCVLCFVIYLSVYSFSKMFKERLDVKPIRSFEDYFNDSDVKK